ncbi:hypothetical protein JCM8547_005973 [Rhodosporidiobolus lusitaniae]
MSTQIDLNESSLPSPVPSKPSSPSPSQSTTASLAGLPDPVKLRIVAAVLSFEPNEPNDVFVRFVEAEKEQQVGNPVEKNPRVQLNALSRVSKDFHELCVPYLWSEVNLVRHSCESILFFLDHILLRYHSTISSLILGYRDTDAILPLEATGLPEQDLRHEAVLRAAERCAGGKATGDYPYRFKPESVRDVLLSAVVAACENLQTVDLTRLPLGGDRLPATVRTLVSTQRPLMTLRLSVSIDSDPHLARLPSLLHTSSDSLANLTLVFQPGERVFSARNPLVKELNALPFLRSLSLFTMPPSCFSHLRPRAPLAKLELSFAGTISYLLVRPFFDCGVAAGLHDLTVGSIALDERLVQPELSPVSLPLLRRLQVSSPLSPILSPALLSFPALEVLKVDNLTYPSLPNLLAFVNQSSSSFDRLECRQKSLVVKNEREKQQAEEQLEAVKRACRKKGVNARLPEVGRVSSPMTVGTKPKGWWCRGEAQEVASKSCSEPPSLVDVLFSSLSLLPAAQLACSTGGRIMSTLDASLDLAPSAPTSVAPSPASSRILPTLSSLPPELKPHIIEDVVDEVLSPVTRHAGYNPQLDFAVHALRCRQTYQVLADERDFGLENPQVDEVKDALMARIIAACPNLSRIQLSSMPVSGSTSSRNFSALIKAEVAGRLNKDSLDLHEFKDALPAPPSSSSPPASLSTLPPELKLKIVEEMIKPSKGKLSLRTVEPFNPAEADFTIPRRRHDGNDRPTALNSLSRVNRDFHELCVPYLWEEINLVSHSCESILFLRKHILPAHAQHVRQLVLGYDYSDELLGWKASSGPKKERERRRNEVQAAASISPSSQGRRQTRVSAENVKDMLLASVAKSCSGLRTVELLHFPRGAGNRLLRTFQATDTLKPALSTICVAIDLSSQSNLNRITNILRNSRSTLSQVRVMSLSGNTSRALNCSFKQELESLTAAQNLSFPDTEPLLFSRLRLSAPLVNLHLSHDVLSSAFFPFFTPIAPTLQAVIIGYSYVEQFDTLSPDEEYAVLVFPILRRLAIQVPTSTFLHPLTASLPALKHFKLGQPEVDSLALLSAFVTTTPSLEQLECSQDVLFVDEEDEEAAYDKLER